MINKNKMIKQLIALANHLDKKGLTKEADYLDAIIKKEAMIPGLALLFTMLTGCDGKCGNMKYNHMAWFFENGTIQTVMPTDNFTEEEIKVSVPANASQLAQEFSSIAFRDENDDGLSAIYKKITFDLSSLTAGKSIFQGKTLLFGSSSSLDSVIEQIKAYESGGGGTIADYAYDGTPGGEYILYFGLDTENESYSTRPLTQDEMESRILGREDVTQTAISSG